jgi:hypothetical protein
VVDGGGEGINETVYTEIDNGQLRTDGDLPKYIINRLIKLYEKDGHELWYGLEGNVIGSYADGGEVKQPTHQEVIEWLEEHPELDGYNDDGTPTDETYQDAIAEIIGERKMAEGGEVIKDGNEYLNVFATKDKMTITLTDEGRAEVEEYRADDIADSIIIENLFESIRNNSELAWHSDLGEMGLGMTSASGVTDGYFHTDDGDYASDSEDARLYYFNDYALRSEVDDLLNGELVLVGADNKMADGGATKSNLPKKLYVGSHLGNTFSYFADNKSYIHSLSPHHEKGNKTKDYSFLAYANQVNPKTTMDSYEIEFDVAKMQKLGFKIIDLHQRELEKDPQSTMFKGTYDIVVPSKYVVPKKKQGESSYLKDVNKYITKVVVFLNNEGFSEVFVDGKATSPYGEKEYYAQEEAKGIWDSFNKPKSPIKVEFKNPIKVGDKMADTIKWGNNSYAEGGEVYDETYEKLYKQFTDKDYFFLKDGIKRQVDNWKRAVEKNVEGADQYTEEDIIKNAKEVDKARNYYTYATIKEAIEKGDKDLLKDRVRYDQKFSKAIYEAITNEKLPSTNAKLREYFDKKKFAKGGSTKKIKWVYFKDYDTSYANVDGNLIGVIGNNPSDRTEDNYILIGGNVDGVDDEFKARIKKELGDVKYTEYLEDGGNIPKVDDIRKRTYYWVADDKDGNILAMGSTKKEVMQQLKEMKAEGVVRMAKGGMVTELKLKDCMKDDKISVEDLTKICGHKPNYPKQTVGRRTFEKCFLSPYYKICK